ncbi:MAG: HAMP domain-containing protein [Gammaproteobacteria bacterium]|nr:HAMP domain-containing protein [Gammaproteobacteria bacterium]
MRFFKASGSAKNPAGKPGNVSITRKLTGLLVGLLLGFIIIGLAYQQVLEADKDANAAYAKMSAFEKGLHEVQLELLHAKKSESDFYLKKYPIFLGKFDTRMIVASQTLKDLTTLVKDENELNIVTRLGDSFETYRDKFIKAAESQIEIGLDENTGLNSELAKTMESIQEIITANKLQSLDKSLLKIGQHHSLLLQKEDNKYKDLVLAELSLLKNSASTAKIGAETKTTLMQHIENYTSTYLDYANTAALLKRQKKEVKESAKAIDPLFDALLKISNNIIKQTRQVAESKRDQITAFFIGTLIVTSLIFSIGLFALTRNIVTSLKKLQDTVIRVNEGDLQARANLRRNDELGQLSDAFDKLLDERLATMAKAEKESEKLNDSVIELIKAVGKLAQEKNLAIKIPVSEDITGAISDSLNLLAKETAKILSKVKTTSSQVANVSSLVKQQSDRVVSVASAERKEVITTAVMLEKSVRAMNKIARDAQDASTQADKTIANTEGALDTVLSSVEGINSIRNTISETEKRIKRLGERSQEISGIVNLINSIAERTHILALNASMHAASAGEAGRGFAVVADEVQRLAENAREATSEISTVVNNIRVETTDTVTTMNEVISKVAEGTRLAEQAGQSMRETQLATNELVQSVQHIASSSVDQVRINKQLLNRAKQIQESTEQTGREMIQQTKSTDTLVDYSGDLVSIVSVFKLPGEEDGKDNTLIKPDGFTPPAVVKQAS